MSHLHTYMTEHHEDRLSLTVSSLEIIILDNIYRLDKNSSLDLKICTGLFWTTFT